MVWNLAAEERYAAKFSFPAIGLIILSKLRPTKFPTFMTPCNLTMFGCWNCPMMAASCSSFILSISEELWIRALIATSYWVSPPIHNPLLTVENAPSPIWSCILYNYYNDGFMFQIHVSITRTLCMVIVNSSFWLAGIENCL